MLCVCVCARSSEVAERPQTVSLHTPHFLATCCWLSQAEAGLPLLPKQDDQRRRLRQETPKNTNQKSLLSFPACQLSFYTGEQTEEFAHCWSSRQPDLAGTSPCVMGLTNSARLTVVTSLWLPWQLCQVEKKKNPSDRLCARNSTPCDAGAEIFDIYQKQSLTSQRAQRYRCLTLACRAIYMLIYCM